MEFSVADFEEFVVPIIATEDAEAPKLPLAAAPEREAIYFPLKDPVYDNFAIQAPDGRVLCRCGRKKVDWYLSRGLAKVVSEDPLTIQLNFVPGGNGEEDDSYQLGDKFNHCVVCGRDDYNTKHHIVEYEYRQHMPLEYKSHNSYDVMILCGPCHAKYEIEAMKIKTELASKYEAPVNGKGWYYDQALGQVRKAGNALKSSKSNNIPASRRAELSAVLRAHFNLQENDALTSEQLDTAAAIDPVIKTADFMSHGQGVVSKLDTPEKMTDFIQMWRTHFLETMNPQHIPPTWGVARAKSELRNPSEKK